MQNGRSTRFIAHTVDFAGAAVQFSRRAVQLNARADRFFGGAGQFFGLHAGVFGIIVDDFGNSAGFICSLEGLFALSADALGAAVGVCGASGEIDGSAAGLFLAVIRVIFPDGGMAGRSD